MIVKNEEKDLPLCLQSVRGLVDEIIVVDTGSKDRTPEVARELGAKVYPFKWTNDFAAARNESIRHATADYILWLDADDVIPEEERERFLEWKKNLPERPTAYKLILESPKEGGDFLNEFCYQLRVFPRLPGVRFIRRIHESVIESLQALRIPILDYDLRILHRGYSRKEDMERKAKRNLKLLLVALAEDPGDSAVIWHLSQTYSLLGDKEKAAHYAELLLKDKRWQRDKTWGVAAISHLANLYRDLGREEEAEKLLLEAIKKDPLNPMPSFFLAYLYLRQKKYKPASQILQDLLRKDIGVTPVPMPPKAIHFYAHLWLGSCYEAMGQGEKALEEYARASEINPRWEDKGAEIGEFHLRGGRPDKALFYLERAAQAGSDDPSLWSNLGIAYRQLGRIVDAERALRHALELEPCHFNALANLGHLMLAQGKTAEAEELFVRASSVGEGLDIDTALLYLRILRGAIEEALPHVERVIRQLGISPPAVLDSFHDLALLLWQAAEEGKRQGLAAPTRFLAMAAEVLLRQEVLLSASN